VIDARETVPCLGCGEPTTGMRTIVASPYTPGIAFPSCPRCWCDPQASSDAEYKVRQRAELEAARD
jgi:hypothetical protein